MNRWLLLCFTLILAAAPLARAQAPSPEQVLGQDRLITLDEAVQLALENNLGLQVERLDPAVARERVRETWGAFEPNFVAGYDRQHLETPTASSVQSFFGTSGNRTTEDYHTYDAGLQGILPWGFQYSTSFIQQKLNSDSGFYALDPQYTGTWRSTLLVPLLRNLYWSTPDLFVRRSSITQNITDEEFRTRLTDTAAGVELAYWELAATRALEGSAQSSVKTAQDLVNLTKVQYQVGVVSKVRITEAEAGLAQREFDLIVRANAAQSAQDQLLTAILAPGISDYANTRLQTEEPTFVPYDVDPEAALEKARAQRPELAKAQLQVTNAETDEKYFWNQKLPELNVLGSYTNNGLAGRQKIDAGTPIGFRDNPATPGVFDPIPIEQQDIGFGTNRWSAYNNFLGGSGDHSWGVTAALTVPIGNDSADARYVQSRIQLRRAKTALRIEEQNVVVDVRNAVRDLRSAIDGVKAAQRATAASAETLRAEQERLRLGDSTPHDVLQFETDLSTAQSNEIRALQVYRSAITRLERAQGTLLEKLRVRVEQERERGVDY